MVVFAKSAPIGSPETLFFHTNSVLQESELLKKSYGPKIINVVPVQYRKYFWDALSLVCKAHDLGKVQSIFQNKLLRASKKESELLPTIEGLKEIPHNIISPAFIGADTKTFPKELRAAIYQAIAFHHGRGLDRWLNDKAWMDVEEVIKKDIVNRLDELRDIQSLFSFDLRPTAAYLSKLKETLSLDVAIFYLMLKGCLHRVDHSGSAHLPVEIDFDRYSSQQVTDYLLNRGIDYSAIWQSPLADSVCDKNVVLQAGTGSGKTEFALFWIGGEKSFYTLPTRTSVNAMYERIKETYGSSDIGLLHGDSAFYALSATRLTDETDENRGINESLNRIYMSRQLSMPISITTADQIFTTAFRYKGYEKIFATLAYSRLVVDEIQSYDPEIIAVVLKTLVDLSKIGCKFCVITATLPRIYLDYLGDRIPNIKSLPARFMTTARHRIKLLPNALDDSNTIGLIKNLNRKYGGVLVIANTVKMAKRVKECLENQTASLLHSMFTYEDRAYKEHDKDVGILKNQKGIWITTQIVEVSLNLNFNVMVTEISSIDSQVQRWGRVWRNRKEVYHAPEPNIYITIACPSDKGYIYDKEVVNLTRKRLLQKDTSLLSDLSEYNLVQEVFCDPSFQDTNYKRKFDTSLRMLEEYNFSVDTRPEAQELFRRISNVTVIPGEIYSRNEEEIDKTVTFLKEKKEDNQDNRLRKLKALLVIRNKSVAVPSFYLKEVPYTYLDKHYKIIIAGIKYSSETGIELEPIPLPEEIVLSIS